MEIYLIIFVLFVGNFALLEAKTPLVIVPGDGGSQLQARINKSSTPHFWCEKTSSSWFDLWLSVDHLLQSPELLMSQPLRLCWHVFQYRP